MLHESEAVREDAEERRQNPSVVDSRVDQAISSEIDSVHSAKVKVLPDSHEKKGEVLQEELEQSLVELRQTLLFTSQEVQELQDDIDSEREIDEQLKNVVASVKQKLETDSADGDDTKKELQAKINTANETFRHIKKSLVGFIKQHFPLPSQETLNETKKKLRSADQTFVREDLKSLKEILEVLLEKAIEEPNDPYIDIDDTFWPPYVELLLRCKIVLRHRDDEKRIKLVSFHL